MLNCLFVGVGGFLGAVARYLCTRLPLALGAARLKAAIAPD